jgi:hypothetical protein
MVSNRGRRQVGVFSVLLFDDLDGDSLADPGELRAESGQFSPPTRRDSLAVTMVWDSASSGRHALVAVLRYPPDMRLSNDTARASLMVSYVPASVVVNEIMPEPVAGRAEYVELLNPLGVDIDLAGWTLRGPAGTTVFSLGRERRILSGGEYLVIASDSTLYTSFPALRSVAGRLVHVLNGSLGLNNDGDDVVIADPGGERIDSVAYMRAWHNPGVDDPAGRSLERIRPSSGSNDPRNWSTCTSPLGGTPGAANSIFTPIVSQATSMSVSPNPFSPDGDGREDFAVVQYRLALQVSVIRLRIYDIRGRLIRTLANNEPAGPRGDVIWDGMDENRRKARIGIYILLLEAIDDRGGTVETAKGTVVLAGVL